jgi:hypothetical protein
MEAVRPAFLFEKNYNQVAGLRNNTYKVLRLIEEDHNVAYFVWCTGERELYDMKASCSLFGACAF